MPRELKTKSEKMIIKLKEVIEGYTFQTQKPQKLTDLFKSHQAAELARELQDVLQLTPSNPKTVKLSADGLEKRICQAAAKYSDWELAADNVQIENFSQTLLAQLGKVRADYEPNPPTSRYQEQEPNTWRHY